MENLFSKLPNHLLDYLLEFTTKQLDLDDLIRFSCVCRKWRFFSTPLLPPTLLPWLIVPHTNEEPATNFNQTLGFSTFHNGGKIYKLETPQLSNRRICGSCQGGWLITVHENGEIQLCHPFSKSVIDLPPLTQLPGVFGTRVTAKNALLYTVPLKPSIGGPVRRTHIISHYMRECYIYKAIMSSSTTAATATVMVIHGFSRKLAIFRPGKDKKWISVKGDYVGKFNDMTYCQGQFFAVRDEGRVYAVCGTETSSPFLKLVVPEPIYFMYYKTYLVECKGDLLLLIRRKTDVMPTYESKLTRGFGIKKIDFSGKPMWVEEVDEIDEDCAVFVGVNDSFMVSASVVPECRGNCIYFTDDWLEHFMFVDDCGEDYVVDEYVEEPFGGHDVGVYSLSEDATERFYSSSSVYIKPPPVWFTMNSQ